MKWTIYDSIYIKNHFSLWRGKGSLFSSVLEEFIFLFFLNTEESVELQLSGWEVMEKK